MDTTHTDHLNRILSNRKLRGASSLPRSSSAASSADNYAAAPPHLQQPQISSAQQPPNPSKPPQYPSNPLPPPQQYAPEVRPVEPSVGRFSRDDPNAQRVPTFQSVSFGAARSSSMATDRSTLDLFSRGAFSNFRKNPILLTPHVKPYLKPAESTEIIQQRAPSIQAECHVTQANPFRNQDFDDFVQAPNYEAPQNLQALSPKAREPIRQTRDDDVDRQRPPVFDLRMCIATLEEGDWFMKWSQMKNKVHRRYFWIDETTGLCWSKTTKADSFYFFTKVMKFSEMTEIQTQCYTDEGTGKVYYLMMIWSVQRFLQIGTELKDKFDVWFFTLQRLSEQQQDQNRRFFGRYTGSGITKREPLLRIAQAAFPSAD